MNKIPKSAVLYIHDAGTQYTCDDCVFFKQGKCALFGPSVEIKPYGSCGFFIQRHKSLDIPWIGGISKKEAGYEENEPGFSCKRCEEFILSGDCKKVDKDSAGNDPGEINKNACCNRWEADEDRAPMSTPDLIKLVNKNESIPEGTEEPAAPGQAPAVGADLRAEMRLDSLHR